MSESTETRKLGYVGRKLMEKIKTKITYTEYNFFLMFWSTFGISMFQSFNIHPELKLDTELEEIAKLKLVAQNTRKF